MTQTLKPAVSTQNPQRVSTLKVFITGASSGIGQALADYYAKQGAILGLVARRQAQLTSFANQLGKDCVIYPLDVRDAIAMDQAAKDFIERFGVPDIVIGNAGVSRGTLTEYKEDIEAFKMMMEINVLGLVHTFQPFIQAMKNQGHGQLVGIASVAGVRGLPGAGAYSASKAAAIKYLESLRVEMIKSNIQVTTIAPGYIRTPMTDINTYRMPFLMDVDVAVTKFAKAIAAKRRFVVIPWQMGVIARLMHILPAAWWDWLAKDAPHKSRAE
ncbi:short-chain dehydrogenase [Methylovorus sp. MM2]|uniref:SDR family oxidoreductase n=1 Tax=Methylovorus sp. MM2 TaxID=1848038 RepID=UPI0007E1F442|nr:SDR family oxidoreductase [Methylovorus sp. MM2]OAM52002.1 short-chain dehydrogenase [Methylovorus sp. MM2]